MHYPRTAFSRNGQDTITQPSRTRRSASATGCHRDLAGVGAIYPGCYPIKNPWVEPGHRRFKKLVDDPPPFKKVRDDNRFKKLRDDDIVVKAIRDPKGPRDPGPVKVAFDPMPIGLPEIVTRPGTLKPFSIATAHHAPIAPDAGAELQTDPGSMTYLAALQRQLLDLEAAIAQARATAAQANADAAQLQDASDAVSAAYDQALDDLSGA